MSAGPDEVFDAQAWLKRAESNLARARVGHGITGVVLEDLCFDAQQAAEKALKALLIARRIEFPKTHAIAELITLLVQANVSVPKSIECAADLTLYAVRTRYPGGPAITEEDYQDAVLTAENAVAWVKRELKSGHPA
jgi:HEPN domain-containing protein